MNLRWTMAAGMAWIAAAAFTQPVVPQTASAPAARPAAIPSYRSEAPEAIEPIDAPFPMPALARPAFPDRRFSIADYGAAADGTTTNAVAIAKAIAACAAAGGGVVVVPAGRWLTGPIRLKSNVNLRVEKGATVLFSRNRADYRPGVFARFEGIECIKYSPFIYAFEEQNIAVTGEGTLEGQADPWWTMPEQQGAAQRLNAMVAAGTPPEKRIFDGTTADGGLRPEFFSPVRCKNVLVEGVEFRFGAFWTVAPVYCENVIIRKVKVTTWEPSGRRMPNGDAIAPESCKNMLIEYCDLQTQDDCVAVKSGKDADGLRVGIPSENIVIRKIAAVRGGGGIVIGSETSGIVRNMLARDCAFGEVGRGILFKTGRGRGGGLEKIWCENISVQSASINAIEATMLFTGQRGETGPVGTGTPFIRELTFNGIRCEYARRNLASIIGIPERPIEKVVFRNLDLAGGGAFVIHDATGIDSTALKLAPINRDSGASISPAFEILDGAELSLTALDLPSGTSPVFQISGAKSRDIRISAELAKSFRGAVKLADGATSEALKIQQ